MPQIVAANFVAYDPLAFEMALTFPYMVRCKQFSGLSSDEKLQCKNSQGTLRHLILDGPVKAEI